MPFTGVSAGYSCVKVWLVAHGLRPPVWIRCDARL